MHHSPRSTTALPSLMSSVKTGHACTQIPQPVQSVLSISGGIGVLLIATYLLYSCLMKDFSRQADLDNSVGTTEDALSILHLLLRHTSLQPVAEHLRVPRAYSVNIFLNARKVTHTIDDHLPVVLRHVVVLRS